jgi:phosphate/sulfate permease
VPIVSSWFITVPLTGIVSAVLFVVLRAVLL